MKCTLPKNIRGKAIVDPEMTKRRLDSFYGTANFQELLHLSALYFSISDSYLHFEPMEKSTEEIDDYPSVMLKSVIKIEE